MLNYTFSQFSVINCISGKIFTHPSPSQCAGVQDTIDKVTKSFCCYFHPSPKLFALVLESVTSISFCLDLVGFFSTNMGIARVFIFYSQHNKEIMGESLNKNQIDPLK